MLSGESDKEMNIEGSVGREETARKSFQVDLAATSLPGEENDD